MTAPTNTASAVSHRIGATGRFTLRIPSGDVTITATDSDVATVRDMDGRSLADRFEIGTADGSLELVARQRPGLTFAIGHHEFGSGGALDLDIEVPALATVVVDTASADVLGKGLRGPKRFRTASGDLVLEATAGDIELDAVSGDVRVDATGVIDVHGKSISGDVRVRAPRLDRFDMATTSGDLWLDAELSGKGPFSIRSISGDVTIVARAGLQVDAQSITGDLLSEVAHVRQSSPGKKHLVIGRPVATLAFKSVSGDLQIVEARDQQVRAMTDSDFPGRPGGSEPTPESPAADAAETNRLEILRSLERGEIDVETATKRLAALEVA